MQALSEVSRSKDIRRGILDLQPKVAEITSCSERMLCSAFLTPLFTAQGRNLLLL